MPADRYLTRTVMGIIATAITFFLVLVIILPIIKNRVHSLIAVRPYNWYLLILFRYLFSSLVSLRKVNADPTLLCRSQIIYFPFYSRPVDIQEV
jgi:hypothetical protein